MNSNDQKVFNRVWEMHTAFINRFARWIILFYILVSGFALYYAVHSIGVNSDSADMFDSSLPFRENQDRFNSLFPLTDETLVIVVEASTPEEADSVSQALAGQLRNAPDVFEDVFEPWGEPFFRENQLLFLNTEELSDLSEKLSASHVFFSLLAQNYSLRGLFSFLDQILGMGNEKQVERLDPLFGRIDSTLKAQMQGQNVVLSWQSLLSEKDLAENRQIRFIQVKPRLDYNSLLPAKPAIERIHELAGLYESGKDLKIRITGSLAMSYEEMQSVMDGAIIASILAFVLVSLTLWIGLRSFRLIFSSLLTLLAGLSLTMAFSGAAVGQLNMISIAFTVLYIGLGIDYAIHFTLKFNELILRDHPPLKALCESFKDLSPALILSTFSTAFGFYAFLPTPFGGVAELGLIAGTGMFVSLIVTFTLLPALLSVWYVSPQKTAEATLAAPFSEQISKFQSRHTTTIRLTSIAIGIFSLILITKISFDYNPINLRDSDTESVKAMEDLMNSDTFTPWTVEILAPDSASVSQYTRQLSKLEPVGRVVTLYSFIPQHQKEKQTVIRRLNNRFENIPPVTKDSASYIAKQQVEALKSFHGRIETYDKAKSKNLLNLQTTLGQLIGSLTVEDSTRQEQLLRQTESALLKTFPGMLKKLKEVLNPEGISKATLPGYVKDRWVSDQGIYRIQVEPADDFDDSNSKLRAFAASITEHAPAATGNLITVMKSGDTVVNAFIQAISYALIVISLLLAGYLRSFKYTLYILLPILLAGVITGAAMVILNLQFNFANIIALPLLFGLGVDNGVHIVHRARNNSSTAKNLLETTTARAIFFSSFTTLFSFGNLAFSPHNGTASLGIVLTLGLLFMLFSTLVVLPAFLNQKSNV